MKATVNKPTAINDVSLQSVDFFISLPSSLDIANGVNFSITEADDGLEMNAVRFVDKDGLSKRFSKRIMIHQVPHDFDQEGVMASTEAFNTFYSGVAEIGNQDRKPLRFEGKVTVAQVSCITDRRTVNQDYLTDQFDSAVASLRDYLKMYHMVTQSMIELVTRQNTSLTVPYAVEDIDENGNYIGERESLEKGIFMAHNRFYYSDVGKHISKDMLNHIFEASSTYLGNSFDQFYNVRREAMLAFDKGNSLITCILVGVAAETLLDELFLSLLWEEGYTPAQARELLRDENSDTTFKRVQQGIFNQKLSGFGTANDKTAVRKWRFKILEMRNKTAHVGYEPSQAEMKEGFDALAELVSFIVDKLCDNIEKYPLSTDMIAGFEGMKKRGMTNRFKQITQDLIYPTNPQRTFGNWKHEVERLHGNHPYLGKYANASPIFMRHANGELMWLLMDKQKGLVARIPDQDLTNHPELQSSLNNLVEIAKAKRPNSNTTIAVTDFKPTYKKQKDQLWYPFYIVSDTANINRWQISYLPPV